MTNQMNSASNRIVRMVPELKVLLTTLFAVSLMAGGVTASKVMLIPLPIIGGVPVPAGVFAIGFAFLCSDLLVEYYGPDYASSVVTSTVMALVAGYALIWVAILVPAAPFYDATAFNAVLGQSGAVIMASVVTILISQQADVRIFAKLRDVTSNRHRWVRNCGSTAVSQGLDTVIFIPLAFAVIPFVQTGSPEIWGTSLLLTVVGQYVVKVGIAALDTPVFYLVTGLINRSSGNQTAEPAT